MITHPILVNRPIVCTPKGVRLCRPSETVLSFSTGYLPARSSRKTVSCSSTRRDAALSDPLDTLPNLDDACFQPIDRDRLFNASHSTHAPKILLLYGSVRERSYSRFATEEAARILRRFGADTRIFNPSGLPLPDDVEAHHPKVRELRELACGPRVWSGARPNGTVRWQAS